MFFRSIAPIKLNGKLLAKQLEEKIITQVLQLKNKNNSNPKLAMFLIGNDPSSVTYTEMNQKLCEKIGFDFELFHFKNEEKTSTDEVISKIKSCNEEKTINGILIQNKVPRHIDIRSLFKAIKAEKDIDGVTTSNFGKLAMGEKSFVPATALAVMEILKHYKIQIEGKHTVIVGRSPILGKPLQALFLNANATVTTCHSKTNNLPEYIKQADIIVGALGQPKFIKGSWIKDNAVVVDAGYHSELKTGDIELEAIVGRCYAYTPVPGGVGPMTNICLLKQVLESYQRQFELENSLSQNTYKLY